MYLIYKLINTEGTGAPGMAQNNAIGLLFPYYKKSCLLPLLSFQLYLALFWNWLAASEITPKYL